MEGSEESRNVYRDLRQKHEVLRNEYQAVKRKLDSKNDALLILSRELAGCQGERDQFKLMADQLRNRCQSLKKQLQSEKDCSSLGYPPSQSLNTAAMSSQLEIDGLKQRLADAEGDIKLLREKIIKHRLGTSEQQKSQRKSLSAHERDELIEELEKSRIEYAQLEQDMKQLLDLKEELVTERDAYKSKYNRLNTELNFIMRGDEKHVVDIDALIMENRFLQQRVKQLDEEKSAALTSLKKYKHIIEKRKPTGILKSTTNHVIGGLLISQRQVKQLLASPENSTSHASSQICHELKTLAATLLETINDKNLALNHQRKSNKITDLENKLHQLEMSGESSNFRGKFEGWCELRGDCADLRSLIPRLDSSETEVSGDLDNEVSGDLDNSVITDNNAEQAPPEMDNCEEELSSVDKLTLSDNAETLHASSPSVESGARDSSLPLKSGTHDSSLPLESGTYALSPSVVSDTYDTSLPVESGTHDSTAIQQDVSLLRDQSLSIVGGAKSELCTDKALLAVTTGSLCNESNNSCTVNFGDSIKTVTNDTLSADHDAGLEQASKCAHIGDESDTPGHIDSPDQLT